MIRIDLQHAVRVIIGYTKMFLFSVTYPII